MTRSLPWDTARQRPYMTARSTSPRLLRKPAGDMGRGWLSSVCVRAIGFNDEFSQGKWGAQVSVVLADGSELSSTRMSAKGDPESPMTREEILAKASSLLQAVAGSETGRMIEAILGMVDNGPVPVVDLHRLPIGREGQNLRNWENETVRCPNRGCASWSSAEATIERGSENETMKRPAYRIGVDIGGTFTDIVLVSDTGQVTIRKVPSTPRDYGEAIIQGVKALLDDIGIPPSVIEQVTHGTTIASNAILEGHGARTALVTTSGFRGRVGAEASEASFPLQSEIQATADPRSQAIEVRGLLRGSVRTGKCKHPWMKNPWKVRADRFKASSVEAVAICLLHSYANPIHEQAIARRLRATLKADTYVTCSSDILREAREYERTSTTVVNAYLGPTIRGYLSSLVERLEALGFARELQLMQSSGALMGAKSIMERPASIIESGPAAGVTGAARIAKITGHPNVIAFDMGGTTAKAALIEDGNPAMTSDYEVGAGINVSSQLVKGAGHAVRLPFIDISEIGAGGGSLITFDQGGHLHVGPQSAGSDPGPVCYDRGGDRPTLTDAFLALGYLNPDSLVGGALRLNAAAAISALEVVAARLNQPLLDACYGIYQLAASTMVRAVKAVTTYRGRDPRDFVLVSYGGNGPLVASGIASILEMTHILVPPSPGVFSATGLLAAGAGSRIRSAFQAGLEGSSTPCGRSRICQVGRRGSCGHAARGIRVVRLDDASGPRICAIAVRLMN